MTQATRPPRPRLIAANVLNNDLRPNAYLLNASLIMSLGSIGSWALIFLVYQIPGGFDAQGTPILYPFVLFGIIGSVVSPLVFIIAVALRPRKFDRLTAVSGLAAVLSLIVTAFILYTVSVP